MNIGERRKVAALRNQNIELLERVAVLSDELEMRSGQLLDALTRLDILKMAAGASHSAKTEKKALDPLNPAEALYGALTGSWQHFASIEKRARANGFTMTGQALRKRLARLADAGKIELKHDGAMMWRLQEKLQ